MNVAIITGASSGIGKEFAIQLDKRKDIDEIWLIAQNFERLEALSKELNHKSKFFSLNLALNDSYETFKILLRGENPNIRYLINAAGFGKTDPNLDEMNGMIDVNIKGVVNLTALSIQYMHKNSRIINIASMAGVMPLPHLNIYAATKAFIIHYSHALHYELKIKGINVSCICPGWTNTNFMKTANVKLKKNPLMPVYESNKVVKRALKLSNYHITCGTYGAIYNIENVLCKIFPKRIVMEVWNTINK